MWSTVNVEVLHLTGPVKFVLIQGERPCRNFFFFSNKKMNTFTCFVVDLLKDEFKKYK